MNFLDLDKVSFSYDTKNIVFKDLSLRIENPKPNTGFCIALMGNSGSGKTTLLKLLLKTLTPQGGRITYSNNSPVISYVPQEPVLFEHLSPFRNAKYFSEIAHYKKLFDENIFESLCQILGMKEILSKAKSVNDLSGGQKQRVLLIRALSIKPSMIFFDEPTTGLDSIVKIQFLQILREIITTYNIFCIYVTHHKLEAELIADEVAYLGENFGEGIQKVYKADLRSFIDAPPLIDAVKVFDYPTANILRYQLENGTQLRLLSAKSLKPLQFAVRPCNIKLTSAKGYSFKIISTNPIYTSIELSSQEILVRTTAELFDPSMKIMFIGTLLSYAPDNSLSGQIESENMHFVFD